MKSLTELFTENGQRKVKVTYPDNNGNHTTTLRDIADRFIQEGAEWRKQFFSDLINNGEAFTRMGGHYQLV